MGQCIETYMNWVGIERQPIIQCTCSYVMRYRSLVRLKWGCNKYLKACLGIDVEENLKHVRELKNIKV